MQSRIVMVLTAVLLAACGSDPQSTETESKARPAILFEVGQNTEDAYLSFPSSVRGQKGSELAFAVSGVVEQVFVKAAQEVEQGEVLAKLDQRDFKSQLVSAQAAFINAEQEYQRALLLLEGNAIPRSEVENRKANRDKAQAQLDKATKALEETVINAPFTGVVARVAIEVLQSAQVGQTAITLLNTAQLKAAINLPSDFIALSKKYSSSNDKTYVTLDVAPEQHIPAEFQEITLEADSASQTYEAIYSFTPPDNLVVLPGMNAMVWLRDPRRDGGLDAVHVPLTAISVEQDEKYVWVVDQTTMTVSKREVSVKDGVGEHVGILSGLEPGETIVAAGVAQLSEGIKVRQWSKE